MESKTVWQDLQIRLEKSLQKSERVVEETFQGRSFLHGSSNVREIALSDSLKFLEPNLKPVHWKTGSPRKSQWPKKYLINEDLDMYEFKEKK